ncbi:MAG: hypothetical protein KAG92_11015 [Deltaproteobacteria bacterium]|nr:hypothetical protein [Deltaproteobacteria bacterium]
MKKILPMILGALLLALVPIMAAAAHPPVTLYDGQGNRIIDQLDDSEIVTAAGGSIYKAGPPYSPKQTCGKCHDYHEITKAYHFREGANKDGKGISDTWCSENADNPLYKYLANAYGHLLSPGQFGAW